jgi:hypothetical protein
VKLIYIAGAYTSNNAWTAEQNVRRAEEAAYEVMGLGAWPLVPHSNTRHYFVNACTYEQAIAGTLEMLRRSDAGLWLPGWELSRGASGEREEARRLHLPAFDTLDELKRWLAVETAA